MTAFQWVIAVDATIAMVALAAWANAWIEWLGRDKVDGD